MRRWYNIKASPREVAKTAIGLKIICDWTDKTDLHLMFPEEKVWGLIHAIEDAYDEDRQTCDDCARNEGCDIWVGPFGKDCSQFIENSDKNEG